MKTQISRDGHRDEKRYSAVYQQMGRMITDADLNEHADIVKERLDDALRDVVASGAPRRRGVRLKKTGLGQPLQIQKGYVYADGVIARVVGQGPGSAFGLDGQADFPSPPPPPNTDYVIYADVWERPVTALEDVGLRDPALHGADTATRTRTMGQIKWCPAGIDPEKPKDNPQRGDARLTVKLREIVQTEDPCDPCAEIVNVDTRIRNYLFRLEVHDVVGAPDAATELTLKWSSENGAEHHKVGTEPPDFTGDEWMYELFDITSESHLGVHLAPGFSPARGQLVDELPDTPAAPFVRRWDGYCILRNESGTWKLVEGKDRGTELTAARVELTTSLDAALESLLLSLQLDGKKFVAGDHWMVPVREQGKPADGVLVSGALPDGIVHHYLRLGNVDGSGVLAELTTPEQRRLHFPPLTDLRARDVGYETACPSGLFDATHDTVKKALDQICAIAAEHIAYTADCPSGLFDATHDTVKKALDQICAIAAGHVAYEAPADCTLLDEATTVQEAIDELCRRPAGGGCRVTVGTGGEFPDLRTALEKLLERGEQDICLCLLAGDHELAGLQVESKGARVAITGCGPGSRLKLTDDLRFTGLGSLRIESIAATQEDGARIVAADCADVAVSGCRLAGTGSEAPLLAIDAATATIRETSFHAVRPQTDDPLRTVIEPIGDMAEVVRAPGRDDEMHRIVDERMPDIGPVAERKSIADEIERRLESPTGIRLEEDEKAGVRKIIKLLRRNEIPTARMVGALRELRRASADREPGMALALVPGDGPVFLDRCDIVGTVTLGGVQPGEELEPRLELLSVALRESGERFEDSSGRLHISGCRISHVGLAARAVRQLAKYTESPSQTEMDALFRSVFLSDNVITRPKSQLACRDLKLTSNEFTAAAVDAATIVAPTASLSGNRTENVEGRIRSAVINLGFDGSNMLQIENF